MFIARAPMYVYAFSSLFPLVFSSSCFSSPYLSSLPSFFLFSCCLASLFLLSSLFLVAASVSLGLSFPLFLLPLPCFSFSLSFPFPSALSVPLDSVKSDGTALHRGRLGMYVLRYSSLLLLSLQDPQGCDYSYRSEGWLFLYLSYLITYLFYLMLLDADLSNWRLDKEILLAAAHGSA